MFTAKNFSPGKLALITSSLLSLPVAIFILIVYPQWAGLLFLILFFLSSYALILNTLQNFIFRKIKLIYKLIYQTKASKREEFYFKNIIPQKSIEEIGEEVEIWSQQYKTEMEILQQNEIFRKEFLQNLSHELKTPLFAIQGYTETLLNGALQNKDVNTKFLQSTSRNVDRLVNLVDDLDQISKLESGELLLYPQSFIIQDLLKEVYDSLFIKAREKEIKCEIKKGCESHLIVYADKEKIRQVFINLIENAIKYGKQTGTIEASFYQVDGKNILIEISDNGYGIAEEHIVRIFERFYRTDAARNRKAGGSGLGLSICKHIIEAHGQTIHVRSAVEVGTTFGFSLPTTGPTLAPL